MRLMRAIALAKRFEIKGVVIGAMVRGGTNHRVDLIMRDRSILHVSVEFGTAFGTGLRVAPERGAGRFTSWYAYDLFYKTHHRLSKERES